MTRFVLDERYQTWEPSDAPTEPQPLDELEAPECGSWGAWLQSERLRQHVQDNPSPRLNSSRRKAP